MEVTDEISGPWAILLLTCAVRGLNPAPDSRLGAGCLVQRTAQAVTSQSVGSSLPGKFVCCVGARGALPVEPCVRRLGELTGRSPDPCPLGLLVFILCYTSGTLDGMQGVPLPVGP